ncbi:MAG: hypothetical protein ABI723_06010 [Bacteroidia bacterium]
MEATVQSKSISNVIGFIDYSRLENAEKLRSEIEDLKMWSFFNAERKKLILCSLVDTKGKEDKQDFHSYYCNVEVLKEILEISLEITKEYMKWLQDENNYDSLKSKEQDFKHVSNIIKLIDSAKENPSQNELFVKLYPMTDMEVLSRFRRSTP